MRVQCDLWSTDSATAQPRPDISPLDRIFDNFVEEIPWHEDFGGRLRVVIPDNLDFPDDLDVEIKATILQRRDAFHAFDTSGPYRTLKARMLEALGACGRDLRNAARALACDSDLPVSHLRRLRGFLDKIAGPVESLAAKIESTPFRRSLPIAGGIGSGKTQALHAQALRSLVSGGGRPLLLRLALPAETAEVHAAILEQICAVTGHDWRSWERLNAALRDENHQLLLALDDFDGLARSAPDASHALLNLFAQIANLDRIFWVFTFLDTNLDLMAEPLTMFRHFGQPVLEDTRILVEGTLMLDRLNEQEAVGLSIVRERLRAVEAPEDFLDDLQPRTRVLLCNPMLAQIYCDHWTEMGPPAGLHYIDLIRRLRQSRISRSDPGIRQMIPALLDAVGRLVLSEGSFKVSVEAARASIAAKAVGIDGRRGLDILAEIDVLRLPALVQEIGGAPQTIETRFALIWQDCLSALLLAPIAARPDEHAVEAIETAVRREVERLDDAWEREGLWQIVLLQVDRLAQTAGRARRGLEEWWDRTATGVDSAAAEALPLPWTVAYRAGVYASGSVARRMIGRLLRMKTYPPGRTATFVLLHFAFATPGLALKDRTKLAARLARAIANSDLAPYFFYLATNAVEGEADVDELFRALNFLSGIEVLENCEKIVDIFWFRIRRILSESDDYLEAMRSRVLDYLSTETANAKDEYAQRADHKPHGIPYFVREHVINRFCHNALREFADARQAMSFFEGGRWYDRHRPDIDRRVLVEMRREANLEIGRWFRNLASRRSNRFIWRSYNEMLKTLVQSGSGDLERTERAFFLLRHTSTPDSFDVEDGSRPITIESTFAGVFQALSNTESVRHLFQRFPISLQADQDT